ncbi:MAG: type III secretion system chaperone [Gammaproteobacteria bacterium]|nr:type III secretion system chaperone [Gammaproteobacteria bacterium]MDE0273954.1 type III secretion system chaperone [Gammaproteobacteria bacterium]
MSDSVLHSLIREFGAAIGLEEMAFDDQQRCNLMFDDVPVSLELSGGEDSLYIYSVLGPEPAEGAKELYSELLKANYAFAQTGGATLALDPGGGGIVLMREEPLEILHLPQLEALIENFVNTAEGLIASVAEASLSNAAQAIDSEPGGQAGDGDGAPMAGTMRV